MPKPSAALRLFSVNCGKANRRLMKKIKIPSRIVSATLRYVTVFHAMWIPGLRIGATTSIKTQPKSLKLLSYVETTTRPMGTKQVINHGSYLRVARPFCTPAEAVGLVFFIQGRMLL